jgi:hypothetical protein
VTSTNSDTPALPLSDERLAEIRRRVSSPLLRFPDAVHELLAEVDRLRADAARLDFLHRNREAVFARPYALVMHLHAYEKIRERIDLDMKYAALAASRPPTGDEGR